MKLFILCLLLVSMVVLNSKVNAERNRIHPGILDPCKRPGGPHPVVTVTSKVHLNPRTPITAVAQRFIGAAVVMISENKDDKSFRVYYYYVYRITKY
ncbi:hypothetical protein DVH24_003638 [Malus domestica]|uniref:Uncharacterized protein n=1 Tax=Malus domestica TaxID=3750 RepID=A0A498IIV4_MALDO|nr:hypothetical protein DVH24_003638 [Malus domestica]